MIQLTRKNLKLDVIFVILSLLITGCAEERQDPNNSNDNVSKTNYQYEFCGRLSSPLTRSYQLEVSSGIYTISPNNNVVNEEFKNKFVSGTEVYNACVSSNRAVQKTNYSTTVFADFINYKERVGDAVNQQTFLYRSIQWETTGGGDLGFIVRWDSTQNAFLITVNHRNYTQKTETIRLNHEDDTSTFDIVSEVFSGRRQIRVAQEAPNSYSGSWTTLTLTSNNGGVSNVKPDSSDPINQLRTFVENRL